MLKRMLTALIGIIVLYTTASFSAPRSYASAVKRASPAVVNVYIQRSASASSNLSPNGMSGQRLRPILKNRVVLGSGVIMDSRGYIITNAHVVRDRQSIYIALSDGRSSRAQLVGIDSETDLAVLKTDLNNLTTISMGNSDKLEVGDIVLAIGNPFGLGRTVTQGIISALGRTAVGLSNIENFIQTDVALNPGSSGGALINTEGQLIGINTGIYTRSGGYQGVSFAIPVNAVENTLQQIIKFGHVKRAWLGAEVVSLDPILARELKSNQSIGVVVDRIERNSPAAKHLKIKDIITSVNGRKVRSAGNFLGYIAQRSPKERIQLTVYRNDVPQQISVLLEARRSDDKLWQDVTVKGKKYSYPDSRI